MQAALLLALELFVQVEGRLLENYVWVQLLFSHQQDLGHHVRALVLGPAFHPGIEELIGILHVLQNVIVVNVVQVLLSSICRSQLLQVFDLHYLDLERILVVNLLAVPPLLKHSWNAFPILTQVFVDVKHEVPVFVHATHSGKCAQFQEAPLNEIIALSEEKKEGQDHDEHKGVVSRLRVLEGLVVGVDDLFGVIDQLHIVEELLSVAQLPVPHRDHHDWRKLQDLEGVVIQLVI